MKVFYGGAIQGSKKRDERSDTHRSLIDSIKTEGFEVFTEHTTGKNYEEAMVLLRKAIGPLPETEMERRIFVRNKMIEAVEGDIDAAIFEVSIPSLGTGVEISHSYLRPRMGLKEIPILTLYEKDYWPNKLSTMIVGIPDEVPNFIVKEYTDLDDAKQIISEFLKNI